VRDLPTRGQRCRIRLLVVVTTQSLRTGDLPPRAAAQLSAVQGERQRTEWLMSRRALWLALRCAGLRRDIGCSFPHRRVSIAHTAQSAVCAVALSPLPEQLVGIGVDTEPTGEADFRTARFFLDDREQAWLAAIASVGRAVEHRRLWTTKEAIFKSDPANQHHILRDYSLRAPEAQGGLGRRIAAGEHNGAPTFGYLHARLADAHLSVAAAFRPSAPSSSGRNVSASPVTFDAVAERISSTLSIPVERLLPDSTLADLAADSFMLVEMVVDLQEEFDSIFTQAELRQITRLGELVALLQSHVGDGLPQ
jgi:acyl carrier protein